MATLRLRPTFSIALNRQTADKIWAQIQASVKDKGLNGQFRDGHGMISYVEVKRHFWSPWLHLDLREQDGASTLHGRFSPHPSIWTAFVFGYLALTVIAFFGLVFGMSQWLSGEFPWGCIAVPVSLVTGLLMWITSQVGQRLAHDEMVELKRLIVIASGRLDPDITS